jgi:uncharacterized protein
MDIRRHADARAFLDAIGPVLRRRPVINQLLLGIAQTCVREPDRYGPGALFYSAELDGTIHGAALQTPPWPVQLSDGSVEAARALAHVFAVEHAIAGVAGPDDVPLAFASVYAHARGTSFSRDKAMGTFELRTVAAVPEASGRRIIADAEHAAVVQAWLECFHDEATPHDPATRPDAGARAVATGRAHIWLDATIVRCRTRSTIATSMAGPRSDRCSRRSRSAAAATRPRWSQG